MRNKPAAFPVGLYGMLLLALCWLTLPGVFAPIERHLVGATCLGLRAVAACVGVPVQAAARPQDGALAAALAERIRVHAAPAATAWVPDAVPVHCAVVGVGRVGGGGQPAELVLDHSYAELAGCSEIVTKGNAYVGTLQVPGVGITEKDGPDDFARVVLPNHPKARALHAECTLSDGSSLQFVVRGAAIVDAAPLRVDLWSDPWRGSRLDRPGLSVFTRALPGSSSPVPAGLVLGTTRIWGYSAVDGQGDLTLGVFVVPAIAPQALSHVVVWRGAPAGAALDRPDVPPARALLRVAGVLHELPGAVHGRFLLATEAAVPDGAAVLHEGRFLGSTRGLAFGSALVTSFAASRQRWNLLALPDADGERPVEFVGRIVGQVGEQVEILRLCAMGPNDRERFVAGWLFTGSNGLSCPAGLVIGRLVPHPLDPERALLQVPPQRGSRVVELLVAGGRR